MKDEVEKLREILITLSDDWLHNLRADFPDKRSNPSDRAIHKIAALFQKAQVEAVRAAYLKGYNSGYKTRLYRERKPKKTGGIAIANELDRLARLGEK